MWDRRFAFLTAFRGLAEREDSEELLEDPESSLLDEPEPESEPDEDDDDSELEDSDSLDDSSELLDEEPDDDEDELEDEDAERFFLGFRCFSARFALRTRS